ncbi:Hypothetical protein D9617_2g054510 [Elsinoe fawcettii]|nr:Hypothetical protein D9617_2g054510 [Elsinoe fawcettii]
MLENVPPEICLTIEGMLSECDFFSVSHSSPSLFQSRVRRRRLFCLQRLGTDESIIEDASILYDLASLTRDQRNDQDDWTTVESKVRECFKPAWPPLTLTEMSDARFNTICGLCRRLKELSEDFFSYSWKDCFYQQSFPYGDTTGGSVISERARILGAYLRFEVCRRLLRLFDGSPKHDASDAVALAADYLLGTGFRQVNEMLRMWYYMQERYVLYFSIVKSGTLGDTRCAPAVTWKLARTSTMEGLFCFLHNIVQGRYQETLEHGTKKNDHARDMLELLAVMEAKHEKSTKRRVELDENATNGRDAEHTAEQAVWRAWATIVRDSKQWEERVPTPIVRWDGLLSASESEHDDDISDDHSDWDESESE